MADQPAQIPHLSHPWLESVARAQAQVAAGQIVDGAGVMQRLEESIAEMEASTDKPARTSRRG